MTNTEEIRQLVYKFGERAVQEYQNEDVNALTAQRVDNYLQMISGFSAALEDELGDLEIQRASTWMVFREEYKSNVDAKSAWEGTLEGLRMIRLKRTLNATDKIIAACKARLRRLQSEGFNNN